MSHKANLFDTVQFAQQIAAVPEKSRKANLFDTVQEREAVDSA